MNFSLSTSYFAGRRLTPAEMAAQTASLGFRAVELGYFTRDVELDLWEDALAAEGLTVSSVHAFAPMPLSMPQLGPEVFSLATPDAEERQAAIQAMLRTLEAAARFGARAVVTHGGRVELREPRSFFGSRPYRSQLSQALKVLGAPDMALVERERAYREAAALHWVDGLSFALDVLLPRFEAAGIALAFENLPGLEAFPDPAECAFLRERFPTPALAAWYDIGHGERKARTGDWPVAETLQLTLDFTVGTHIHDVRGVEEDHCAPGEGTIDYTTLLPLLQKPDLIRVFEPSPYVEEGALREGLARMKTLLGD
jgi:sugar phosphate isomerase/epimerase